MASFELRQRAGALLPFGNSSSFLSPTQAAPVQGDSDLGRLLRSQQGKVQGISHEGNGPLGRRAAPVQPFQPQLARFRPTGGMADIGQFNIKHFSDGTLTEGTIENMHKAVLSAKTNAKWRQMMEDIRQHYRKQGLVGWKDFLGELRALDHWYRGPHFIDYVRDPNQVEMVVHPMLTYAKGVGDCDDSSVLFAASAGALGGAHRFRTYKADPRRPDEWSHVVSQVFVPGHGWVNNDLTLRGAPVGFEPGGFVSKDWPEPRW